MSGNYFCECLETLAATFDCDYKASEENLNIYFEKCQGFPPRKRTAVRMQLVRVIGGLARLETRLADEP